MLLDPPNVSKRLTNSLIGGLVAFEFYNQESRLLLVNRKDIDASDIRRELVARLGIVSRFENVPFLRKGCPVPVLKKKLLKLTFESKAVPARGRLLRRLPDSLR